MAGSDEKPSIPSWQRDADTTDSPAAQDETTASETASSTENQLDVARRFLQDDAVKNQSREKKAAFLKEKGIGDGDIETLLSELTMAQTPEPESSTASSTPSTTPSTPSSSSTAFTIPSDRPPIVTYPEFLTQPPAPPPLVTTTALLTTLSSFFGLATLLHGTSRYLLQPMHESLTEARLDLHATASDRLNAIVSRLEETVSEIPPHASAKKSATSANTVAGGDGDEDSSIGDPTEMFHRDIGTQTSALEDLPPSSSTYPTSSTYTPSPSEIQATRLQNLLSSLQPISESFRTQSTDFDDIGTLIDVFRDDLVAMGANNTSTPIYGRSSSSSYNGYSYQLGNFKEPDDEIKKARDGIRRVKGLLLSTRNFPASTA